MFGPWQLMVVLSVLVLSGCAAPGDSTTVHIGAPTQQPPASVAASPLVDTHWRLEQASYNGQAVTFAAAGPIYLTFAHGGSLEVSARACGQGQYEVAYRGGTRYQLANPAFPDLTCRDPARAQLYAVVDALEVTAAYELQGEQLILRGPDSELHLSMDKP
jgi:heat shock protein HslJ